MVLYTNSKLSPAIMAPKEYYDLSKSSNDIIGCCLYDCVFAAEIQEVSMEVDQTDKKTKRC